MMSGYMLVPHDVPPLQVRPPRNFDNVELYPAVTITARRAEMAKLGEVVEREDELGQCLVMHFEVLGTLVVVYQSAADAKNHWTILVNMLGCVEQKQPPTRLGIAVIRNLSGGTIEADWINEEADTEYRSRRRKAARAELSQRALIRKTVVQKAGGTPRHHPTEYPAQVGMRKTGGLRGVYASAKIAAATKATGAKSPAASTRKGPTGEKSPTTRKPQSKK